MLCIVLVLLFAGCGKDGDTSKVLGIAKISFETTRERKD